MSGHWSSYPEWARAEVAAGRRLRVAEPIPVGVMAYRTPDGRLHPLMPEMLDRVDPRDRFLVAGPEDTEGTVAVIPEMHPTRERFMRHWPPQGPEAGE